LKGKFGGLAFLLSLLFFGFFRRFLFGEKLSGNLLSNSYFTSLFLLTGLLFGHELLLVLHFFELFFS